MIHASKAGLLLRTKGLAFAVDIAGNLVLPFIIYSCTAPKIGDVHALLASSIPPILWSAAEFIRHRRLDALSVLVLTGTCLSLFAFFGGGGLRMLQVRKKLVTGVIGMGFLVSAAIGRPLIYKLTHAAMTRSGSMEADRMHKLRNDRGFHRTMTMMTTVWGFGLLANVAIGVVLIFHLTIKQYLIVNSIEGYVVLGILSMWTLWYSRRSKTQHEAFRAAEAVKDHGKSDG